MAPYKKEEELECVCGSCYTAVFMFQLSVSFAFLRSFGGVTTCKSSVLCALALAKRKSSMSIWIGLDHEKPLHTTFLKKE